jgi:hypothetical protein
MSLRVVNATSNEAPATVCVVNIGPKQRQKRKRMGFVHSAIAIAGGVILLAGHFATPWRLLLLPPVFLAPVYFLQARGGT